MRSLLRLEQQHRRLFKSHFEFAYFSFFLTHLESRGIETINTFIHSRRFLKNHTRFQNENRQSLFPFLDRNRAKPLPFRAAHTYMAYIREYLPPGERNIDPCKLIQDDLGFWIQGTGFRIPCQWNVDSGIQSLEGIL